MSSLKQQKYWESMKGKQPKNMDGLKLGHGWNKKEQKIEMINCACGCGNELNKFDSKGRERIYIFKHAYKIKHSKQFKKQHKVWNKGIPMREKAKEKMMLKLGLNWKNKKITSIEKILYEFLLKQSIYFEKQKLINKRFFVDAFIPSRNLIIEADGNYWHSLEKVKKKDKAENAYLMKCGFNLLRLTETEINNGKFIERMGF